MRRVVVLTLVALLLVSAMPVPAHAGAAVDVALGLAAFAVFNQLFWWYAAPAYAERVVVYSPAPIYVSQPPAYAAPAAPTPTAVEYPHGRYELRGDGVTTAYVWVWIPKIPPLPAPPPLQSSPQAPSR